MDDDNDFKNQLRQQTVRETARSRYRDRVSRERVHPIDYDVSALINFALERRLRHPQTMQAVRRATYRVDTDALRLLVHIATEGGATNRALRARCARVLGYCDTIEAALALRDKFYEETNA
ncbi:MAG: hypothetical protein KA371_20410 [Acidobacteria bacterium]|nr:hypothetical protein [Acidobacteriota bacterium]